MAEPWGWFRINLRYIIIGVKYKGVEWRGLGYSANIPRLQQYPGLFFVAIAVVDADERAAKGEYLAEGDEDRVMDFADGLYYKARHKHYAPEGT